MEERKGLSRWVRKHKKELIIAGFSITALLLIVWGLKNRDKIKAVWGSLRKAVKQPTAKALETVTEVTAEIPSNPIQEVTSATVSNSVSCPIEVSSHVRNLPNGWHASPEKIAEAQKYNIILMDGQTWVNSFTKGGAAA